MPELPEVETIKLHLHPAIVNKRFTRILIRQKQLRFPITPNLSKKLINNKIINTSRRGKYLILHLENGNLLMHFGMSGYITLLDKYQPFGKHDHVDFILNDGTCIRYTDPRRFGAIIWSAEDLDDSPLLSHFGVEPLSRKFNKSYLYNICQNKSINIKTVIMDNKIVTGVGNIYATEALFLAGILPHRKAKTLNIGKIELLVSSIKQTLRYAIKHGGTTFKDFANPMGQKGKFQQKLWVYGRKDQPCYKCQTTLKQIKIANRTTIFCPKCQK